MKLAPYPEYKDSGVPWLGKIPAHWELHRGKWLFRKMERPVRSQDEVVTCFRDGTVTLRKNRRIRGFTESLKEIGYQGIRKGDLVIHQMDAFAGAVGVSDSDGKGTPVYSVCLPKRDLDTHYYAQLVREMSRSYFITSLAKGIRERSTDFRFDTFASLTLPVPLPEEQKAISRFMRNESAQINKFIRNKRRFIELLKEQKQNVINQAVTRGLDPKVKFKPSGVEWIGDIPEHWEACQLKRYLLRNDGGVWGSGFSEDGVIVFRSTEQTVDGQWRITDPARRILTEAERIGAILEAGDLLVTKSSGSPSHIGKTTLVTDEIAALSPCFSNFMQRLRVKQRVEPEYLWLYMNSRAARTQLQYLSNSTTGLGNLSESIVGRIVAFLPPKPEQLAILSGLKSEMTPIDTAIQKAENEIELMREYRTRLISDVVTGQVDVRNMKCEGGSLNEDEFEDIEEVEEEIELPEGGEDDE